MSNIIFFIIVFSVYGAINYYIINRALLFIPAFLKPVFLIIAILIAASFIAGRILERYFTSFFTDLIIWVGSYWFAFMFYFFLSLVVIDFARLINHFIPFFPSFINAHYEKAKSVTAIVVICLVTLAIVAGRINMLNPIIKNYSFDVNKNAGGLKSLNVVLISDVHLGTIIGKSFLHNIEQKINALNPDIVLMAGDVVDEDVQSVIKNNIGDELRGIKSKYGVFAITGNHEYIGGVEPAVKYLTEHGINVLRDSVYKIEDKLYIVGREDRAKNTFTKTKRKSLPEIMEGVDKSLPVILMDHQPFALQEAVENGADIQLSGHTHNGQLWPLNFITDLVYEVGFGYKKKENTHVYVSCGVGGWGPPVRTNSRPEIINIKVNFKND